MAKSAIPSSPSENNTSARYHRAARSREREEIGDGTPLRAVP
jgi:hypothetical protein